MRIVQALKIVILVILVVFAVIFINNRKSNKSGMFLKTIDNKKIAANLYKVENPKGRLILAHSMPETKESWDEFAKKMQEFGYESLAIDLRGHGQSESGPAGYKKFSDEEHQAGIHDLEAAWDYLRSSGANPKKTVLIGASIGANLALEFIAKNPDFKKAVFLSPGFDYRGIKTEPLVLKLQKDQSAVFATSKDDGNNAAEVLRLYEKSPKEMNKHIIIYDHGGHGTAMLKAKNELDLTEAIKKFLENGTIN